MEGAGDIAVKGEVHHQTIRTVYLEPKGDRNNRREVGAKRNGGCDNFDEKCRKLEREFDDFQKEIQEDYLRRHWLTGIRIFVSRPIHST